MVTHLMETGKLEHATAKKSIDADYVRGFIVFKSQVEIGIVDGEAEVVDAVRPRSVHARLIQRDYETKDFGVLDAAREKVEFKNFNWDALMVEANAEDDKKKWSKWQRGRDHRNGWDGWNAMTFQDTGTSWGSGVTDGPRAEMELCAAQGVKAETARGKAGEQHRRRSDVLFCRWWGLTRLCQVALPPSGARREWTLGL